MKAKAQYGSKCNQCGLCCMAGPCPFAMASIPKARKGWPCPAIAIRGGDILCGAVISPEYWFPKLCAEHGRDKIATAAALLVGIDTACDAATREDFTPARQRRVKKETLKNQDAAAYAALLFYG